MKQQVFLIIFEIGGGPQKFSKFEILNFDKLSTSLMDGTICFLQARFLHLLLLNFRFQKISVNQCNPYFSFRY